MLGARQTEDQNGSVVLIFLVNILIVFSGLKYYKTAFENQILFKRKIFTDVCFSINLLVVWKRTIYENESESFGVKMVLSSFQC